MPKAPRLQQKRTARGVPRMGRAGCIGQHPRPPACCRCRARLCRRRLGVDVCRVLNEDSAHDRFSWRPYSWRWGHSRSVQNSASVRSPASSASISAGETMATASGAPTSPEQVPSRRPKSSAPTEIASPRMIAWRSHCTQCAFSSDPRVQGHPKSLGEVGHRGRGRRLDVITRESFFRR